MQHTPKLLLVDDEPLVQRSMEKTLFRAGFEVEVAAGLLPNHWGVEAAAIYWHYVDLVWVFFYPAIYLMGTAVHG